MALNLLIFNMFEDLSHSKIFKEALSYQKNDSVKRNNIGNNCKIANSVSLINSKNIFIGNDVIIEDSVLLNAEYGKGIYIEDNVTIKRFTTITSSGYGFSGGYVKIGKGSHIGTLNVLTGHAGLDIGNNCLLGPFVSINGYSHKFDQKDELIKRQGDKSNPIKIGNDVYIATRSSVIKGDIGDGCIISAHSLVNKDFKPFSVIRGLPAKFVKFRYEK